ncbi:MAG: fibrobacter succinogenes major paralogous domain-containing protein [Prolixibacteraceae bacterium]|nr:fibrobacter succinogenes major paralogous domain-containing protein [Prolixibacteraceae bacterium]
MPYFLKVEIDPSADGGISYSIAGVSTFTDSRDNKTYRTIRIGSQIWMAENLAYLPSVSPPASESRTNPYYYVYDYSGTDVSEAKATANYTTYGVLYNWPAATTACPSGWHLPTKAEWTILEDYLTDNGYGYGGSGDDIGKSLASTSALWDYSGDAGDVGNYLATNNSSGFGALPGGYRIFNGNFGYICQIGSWWSATEDIYPDVWYRDLSYYSSDFYYDREFRESGLSVRCVRDN